MKVKILPSKISGSISAPPSKSYTHRAIIIASLASGTSVVKKPLMSDDTKYTIYACKKLGAKIDIKNDSLIIEGVKGHFPKTKSQINIFCGLSGTTMRLITAVSGLSENKIVIDGEKRLKERPMKNLLFALRSLGMNIYSADNNDLLPVCNNGGVLKGGDIALSGKISSQFVSALLLISPFAEKDTTIRVSGLRSKPYVDITVDLMKTFGVSVKVDGEKYFIKSNQSYKSRDYKVEGDYSSASYFFAAAAISESKVVVNNLHTDSVQGDKYFLEVLKKMKRNKLPAINLDLGNHPDIVPTAAVMASTVSGKTVITNIKHLRTKESDRIKSLEDGLRRMRIKTRSTENSLTIEGGTLFGAEIYTYNDHRIAMSFAVAGLVAEGETIINNAEVVNKSYPNFWQDLQKVGANIEIIN